jgi:hypothetical protein
VESVSLLHDCRDRAAERLPMLLDRVMEDVDSALNKGIETARHTRLQRLYAEARRELHAKRAILEHEFRIHFLQAFNTSIRTTRPARDAMAAASDEDDEDRTDLRPDLAEEERAVTHMVEKLKVDCREQLRALDQRMGQLLNDPELRRSENPMRPETICRAFQDACGKLGTGAEVKLLLIKQFERYMASAVRGLYDEMNAHLATQAAQSVADRAAAQPRPTTAAQASLPAFLEAMQAEAAAAMQPPAPGSPARPDPFHNHLNALRHAPVVVGASARERFTLDICARIFDYILADETVAAHNRMLIGALQIPFLRAALLDREVFARKPHPIKRLINLLARCRFSVQAATDELFGDAHQTVARVLRGFGKDPGVITEQIALLEPRVAAALDVRAAATGESPDRATDENLDPGRAAAVQIIHHRLQSVAVPDFIAQFLERRWLVVLTQARRLEPDDEGFAWQQAVRTMDELLWSTQPKLTAEDRQKLTRLLPQLVRHLKACMADTGMERDAVQAFMTELTAVHLGVLSGTAHEPSPPEVRPSGTFDDRAPAGPPAETSPAPLATQVLERTTASGSSFFTSRLDDLFGKPRTEQIDPDAVPELIADFTADEATSTLQPAASGFQALAGLACGDLMEFTDAAGQRSRARLTSVDAQRGCLRFKTERGGEVVEKSREELAIAFEQGLARIIDPAAEPLVERAFAQLARDLGISF